MNVFDNNGTFSQELVIEGMKEMEENIKEKIRRKGLRCEAYNVGAM